MRSVKKQQGIIGPVNYFILQLCRSPLRLLLLFSQLAKGFKYFVFDGADLSRSHFRIVDHVESLPQRIDSEFCRRLHWRLVVPVDH
jgi:hypothetical protein